MNKYATVRPIHPGEILKGEIEYRGISQVKLAKQMEMPYTMLNHILNERRPLTIQTAMQFEAALGISAFTLMGMQTNYNIHLVNQDKSFSERLAQIREMVSKT
ncbi:MAG: HigA family addiction module antidote protein [Candidatus Symbiothrix sp.]|jgi:addiction module HigA family antidote|nr:HigA family addiction module antidote protein [Candidatus Symbiothrix sp.]